MENRKSFFGALFDLSFNEIITLKLIKVLYCIGIGIAGIAACWLVFTAFFQTFAVGLLHLILAPIVFLLLVIISRIKMELFVALFKIEENTRKCAPAEVQQAVPESIPAESEETTDTEIDQ